MRKQPHILFITIDQCRSDMLQPYGCDHTQTPTANRLASEGVTFEHAFTCHTKCTPSRAALMSGRYPHTGGHRTLPGFELRRGELILPQILKQAGYRTAMFGKNHTVENELVDEIFDEHTDYNLPYDPGYRDTPPTDTTPLHRAFFRGTAKLPTNDDIAIDAGVSFMKRHCAEYDTPFFLLYNITLPHPVYMEFEEFIGAVRAAHPPLPVIEPLTDAPPIVKALRETYDLENMTPGEWRTIIEAYASMVSYCDAMVGRAVTALDELGIAEDTLVIYTSDHGDMAGRRGLVEKYDSILYDDLTHVPLIMRLPKQFMSGSRLCSLTEHVDLAPTVLEVVGLDIPPRMQGKSLASYASGLCDTHKDAVYCEGGVEELALQTAPDPENLPPEHRWLWGDYYWKHKTMVTNPWTMAAARGVRTLEWKLIVRQGGECELYDLVHDAGETVNVAGETRYVDVFLELMKKLLLWEMLCDPDEPPVTAMIS